MLQSIDEQILEAIKSYVYECVKHAKLTTDDAWFADKELLDLYLQLHILDALKELDAGLEVIYGELQQR